MNSDFEPPPKGLSVLASVGGVVTAVITIALLNSWSKQLSLTSAQKSAISTQNTSPEKKSEKQAEIVARLDAQSVSLQGTPITKSELAATTPYVASGVGTLTSEEIATARQA